MNTENQQNNPIDREEISADERQIRRLIGGLDKVSAPKDFDFRLKARIAANAANGEQIGTSPWRAVRYALPLTATLAVAIIVSVQAGLFTPADVRPVETAVSQSEDREPVRQIEAPFSNSEIARAVDNSAPANAAEADSPPLPVEKPADRQESPASRQPFEKRVKFESRPPASDDPIRSKDFTVRPSNVQIRPEGINPDRLASQNKDSNSGGSVNTRDVLNFIGIETEADGEKLRVKSVTENSLAGRSGIKAGDVIEAIDDQKIDSQNIATGISGGRTMTVTRGGETLRIELKPD